jgi:hypothetical protein
MTDDDDWAPLPLDQRLVHPGEQPGALPSVLPGAPPAPPPAASPPRVRTPPTAEALSALAALQQRIAATPPSTSLIAEVQHHTQRAEQKRRAGTEPRLVATLVHAPAAVPSEPKFEIDDRASDRAARELEPWFLQLPPTEQTRLQEQWSKERHQYDGLGKVYRRRLGRALGYGALLFFAMAVLQSPMLGSFALVPVLTLAGAVAALLGECIGGGRFVYSLAGAIAFMVVMGPMIMVTPFGLMSLMIASYGLGAIGMDGEMRRSGGFGDA